MATITAKEFALKVGSDPRTVRKFLRSDAIAQGGKVGEDTPGKGSRYAIEAKQVRSLTTRFNAWKAANEAKILEKAQSDTPDEGDDEVIEDEVLEETTEDEVPTED